MITNSILYMKKYFFTLVVATALFACNNTTATTANPDQPAEAQEEVANVVTGDEAKPEEDPVAELKQQMDASSDFTPSGDINRDAQAIVDAQLDIALKEVDGTLTKEERDKVSGMLIKLGQYYTKAGKQDEFQQVLGQKLAEAMKKLKMEKLGS